MVKGCPSVTPSLLPSAGRLGSETTPSLSTGTNPVPVIFAVTGAHLHVVGVHQAVPAVLAVGGIAQRIHIVEHQLRLVDQLRIGFLQQVVADQRSDGERDADGTDGQQHDDAGDQFRAQRNRIDPSADTSKQRWATGWRRLRCGLRRRPALKRLHRQVVFAWCPGSSIGSSQFLGARIM